MKKYSLKRRVLFLMAGFCVGVLLIGIVNAAAAFKGRSQMQKMYELFAIYNDYDDAIEELKETTVDYFIHGRDKNKKKVLKKASSLNEMAEKMQNLAELACNGLYERNETESDYYAFYDLCSVSKEFINRATAYAEQKGEVDIQDVTHMSEITLLLHDMLQEHVENIANSSILLSKKIWQFQIWAIVIIFSVMLFYTINILYHLFHQVLQPIVLLTEKIQHFHKERGQAKEDVPITSCYEELMILYDEYSKMTGTIEKQIVELEDKARIAEELRKKETALANAEFSLMQSLISPHFLYNCLSTISSLATIVHATRTFRGAVMIANFLREALNNVGQYVTVWEEINYTQHYIEIQKLRFGDIIHFSVFCDPQCAKVKVPAILLQPLIENAISHGVKHMGRGAEIQIGAKTLPDGIELYVCDNGAGISEEKQKELKEVLESDYAPSQKGVGLRSVAYRLRDIYGEDASVQIESKKGDTKVHLYVQGENKNVFEESTDLKQG